MDEHLEGVVTDCDISDAERALFERFISSLDDGRYDECRQIAGLMERLSLI